MVVFSLGLGRGLGAAVASVATLQPAAIRRIIDNKRLIWNRIWNLVEIVSRNKSTQRLSYRNYTWERARIKGQDSAVLSCFRNPRGVLHTTPTIGDNPGHEKQMAIGGSCGRLVGRLLVKGRADDKLGR
jgi:hypothetical protein